MSTEMGSFKTSLRVDLLARRSRRSPADRVLAAEALALHASSFTPVTRARRVACYLSTPEEPGTGPLLALLESRGIEAIVPIMQPGNTLDWAIHDGRTETGRFGIEVPLGPRLGAEALNTCQLVFAPALAVDHAGHRLGRGAGYYDRALQDFRGIRCALVFEDELLAEVPHEDHDVPVHAAITPGGIFRVQSRDVAH